MTTTLQKLDIVLQIINELIVPAIPLTILFQYNGKYLPLERDLLQSILDKLQKDGHIEAKETNEFLPIVYTVTFDGLVFIEEGGYLGKLFKEKSNLDKERSAIEVNKTIQYVIAATGIISSIYYILQILVDVNGTNSLFIGITAIVFFGVYTFARKHLSQIIQVVLFVFLFVSLIWIIRSIVPKNGFHIQKGQSMGHPNSVPWSNKVPPIVP